MTDRQRVINHVTSIVVFGLWGHFDPPSAFAALAAAFLSLLANRMGS